MKITKQRLKEIIKGMEELLLRALFAREKMDVVNE